MRNLFLLCLSTVGLFAAAACSHADSGSAHPEPGGSGGANLASSAANASTGTGGSLCPGPFCDDGENCGAQGHSCLGGGCANGLCQPVALAQDIQIVESIALDETNVYASTYVNLPVGQPCSAAPRLVAFDLATHAEETVVECSDLPGAGANVNKLVLADDLLFWTTATSDPNAAWLELFSTPAQGGTPLDLGDASWGDQFAVDATSVFYSHQNGALLKMNLDGSAKTQLSTDFARTIAVDDSMVYYSIAPCYYDECNTEPSIHSVPKIGGETVTLVDEAPSVDKMIVSGGYLYWVSNGAHSGIYRIPSSGGPTETMVSTPAPIVDFALDESSIYWLQGPLRPPAMYEVYSVGQSGGAPQILATLNGRPYAIAVGSVIVWSAQDEPDSMPYSGSVWMLAK